MNREIRITLDRVVDNFVNVNNREFKYQSTKLRIRGIDLRKRKQFDVPGEDICLQYHSIDSLTS